MVKLLLLCGVVLMMAVPAAAQEQMGPPPELRKNLDAFQKGVNATVVEYEAMGKATFSPAFYKSQTPAQRAAAFTQIRADFGTVQFGRVERNGPDAPLVDGNHRVAGIWTGLARSAGDLLTYKGSPGRPDPCWDVVQR